MIAAFFCSLVEFNCPISLPLLTSSPLIWRSFRLVFRFVSAPSVPRCRRVSPLRARAVALWRGFIYKKIVASSLFLIIYE